MRCFANRGVGGDRDRVLGHHIGQAEIVVEHAVEPLAVLVAKIPEGYPQNVVRTENTHQTVPANHRYVMDICHIKDLAHLRQRLMIVHGRQLFGHDFRNRFVLLHRCRFLGIWGGEHKGYQLLGKNGAILVLFSWVLKNAFNSVAALAFANRQGLANRA